jgi:NAD(P)-dependent dehydrogenase (short-subunit alcohol dehydrogenase family)
MPGLGGLVGKVVVIAGGATGIGAATARRLGREGCLVVVGDIAADAARQTADEIIASNGTATAAAFDLSESASVAELIRTAVSTYGGRTRYSTSAATRARCAVTPMSSTSSSSCGIA